MTDTQPSQTGFFHFQIKHGTRSKGHNALAAAAYRTGTISFYCERNGRRYAFARKSEVVCGGIVAPDGCPAHLLRRDSLWNTVENVERREDSQLFVDLVLGLPRGLSVEQNVLMATNFIEEHFASRGMIADWSYHDPAGKSNPHLHVMVTQRNIDPNSPTGFGMKNRSWNDRSLAESWREGWANAIRTAGAAAGIDLSEVDHRSYARRGIDQQPTRHQGRRTPGNALRWDALSEENEVIMGRRQISDARARVQELQDDLKQNEKELLTAVVQDAQNAMANDRRRPVAGATRKTKRTKKIVGVAVKAGVTGIDTP